MQRGLHTVQLMHGFVPGRWCALIDNIAAFMNSKSSPSETVEGTFPMYNLRTDRVPWVRVTGDTLWWQMDGLKVVMGGKLGTCSDIMFGLGCMDNIVSVCFCCATWAAVMAAITLWSNPGGVMSHALCFRRHSGERGGGEGVMAAAWVRRFRGEYPPNPLV